MTTPYDPAADAAAWRDKRRQDAEAQATAARHWRDSETAEARILVRDFARRALEAGLRPHDLRAVGYNNRGNYRTALQGWRLQRSGLLAVSVGGELYDLSVPTSRRALLTGIKLTPIDPMITVGVGGPDGTSMPLAELLQLRLDGGNDWRP